MAKVLPNQIYYNGPTGVAGYQIHADESKNGDQAHKLDLTMTPEQLKETLVKLIKAGLPALIVGQPGVGKTEIMCQAAEDVGANVIVSHPVVSDPTDYKGMPYASEGKAEFLTFGDLQQMIDAGTRTVVVFDDLGQAPSMVQAALMQVLGKREINGKKISKHITFLAATNDRNHHAGVTGMLEPVKSRFATILRLKTSLEDWIKWAITHDMPSELIALFRFDANIWDKYKWKPTAEIENQACPRTIAYMGKLHNAGIVGMSEFAGAVGEGLASEYLGFLKIVEMLPTIDGILLNPDRAEVPEESSALYAISTTLASKITKDNLSRVLKYLHRIPEEFMILCMKDAAMRESKILQCKAAIEWGVKYSKFMS